MTYVAPQGRPRSIPPMTDGADHDENHHVTQIELAKAAYLAGMPSTEIRNTYGVNYSRMLSQLEAEGKPLRQKRWHKKVKVVVAADTPPRPVREEGEHGRHYGARVLNWKLQTDPELKAKADKARAEAMKKWSARRRAAKRRAERQAEAAAVVVQAPQTPAPVGFFRRWFGWLLP